MLEDNKIPEKFFDKNLEGKIIFIRHGQNELNIFAKKYKEKELEKDPKFFDSHLTKLGINQAEEASKNYIILNIEIGYVSPLYRTLETALNMFKTHPKKDYFVFKIHPLLIENLFGFNEIVNNIEEHKKLFNMNSIVKFDWSLFDKYYPSKIDKDLFFLNNVTSIDKNSLLKIKENLISKYNTNNYIDELSNLIKSNNNILESFKHCFDRINEFLNFIKNEHKYTFNDSNNKIIIISHYTLCALYTSKNIHFSNQIKNKFPKDGVFLNNCEGVSIYI